MFGALKRIENKNAHPSFDDPAGKKKEEKLFIFSLQLTRKLVLPLFRAALDAIAIAIEPITALI